MKKIILVTLLLFIGSPGAFATVKTKTVTYNFSGTPLKGFLAWDDAVKGKRPGILVVHEFWGLNDYARGRAQQLAQMGYVAFAADMYGDGRMSTHPEEAMAMMKEVRENMKTWMGRANAALKVLRDNKMVDGTRLAAIGYCFGGATVLNLAYTGADIKAAVSFHGALPVPESTKDIKARLLILQGADDPHVSPETIQKLKAALDEGKVNYKYVSYPGAMHGFTVPDSEKLGLKGIAYNADADHKSWQEMVDLFQEVFKTGK